MPAAPKKRRLENLGLEQQALRTKAGNPGPRTAGFKNEGWKTWT